MIRRLEIVEIGLDLLTTLIIARMFIYPGTGDEEAKAWESIAGLINERATGIKDATPFSGCQARESTWSA